MITTQQSIIIFKDDKYFNFIKNILVVFKKQTVINDFHIVNDDGRKKIMHNDGDFIGFVPVEIQEQAEDTITSFSAAFFSQQVGEYSDFELEIIKLTNLILSISDENNLNISKSDARKTSTQSIIACVVDFLNPI